MPVFDVVIVGGGQAGAHAAISLRGMGFAGTIAIVSDEPDLPYERPPLSKEYLSGEKTRENLLFRDVQTWNSLGVELLLSRRVVAIDARSGRLMAEDGVEIAFGKMIWAAGGEPRPLRCSGHDLAGVHFVRRRSDVDRILAELPNIRHVTAIGGGYIGLEVAAVLAKQGKKVTVLEAQDRVLARVAGEPLSRFFEQEHRGHGVDIRLGCMVDAIEGRDGRACGVHLATGERVAADMIIAAIGIDPAIDPLAAAGADCSNGVRVDDFCKTSLPGIYAVGDCAEHRNPFAGGDWVRLESVQNANDQAMVAAKSICGNEEPYRAIPWFWSNQYDIKLQTAGLSQGYDDCVVRGDPATRAFSVIYLRGGRMVALDSVNSVRDYTHGKALIAAGVHVTPGRLADPATPLRSHLQKKE